MMLKMRRLLRLEAIFILILFATVFVLSYNALAQDAPAVEQDNNVVQNVGQLDENPDVNIEPTETTAPIEDVVQSSDNLQSEGGVETVTEQPVEELDEKTAREMRMAKLAAKATPQDIGVDPDKMASVLFTYQEHLLILEAENSIGDFSQEVTDDEVKDALGEEPNEVRPRPPPEERDISLNGIVYTDANDWVIWLNGKRILPDALPKEILALKVYKDYIDMKWLDDYSRQVYPIRLRAHQRFNLDARIFLPG